jgi:hypothetical protein
MRLEKSRGSRQRITAVRKPDQQVTGDLLEILATWRDFYENLFTASPVDSRFQNDMFSKLESTLSSVEADSIEGPLALVEV